MATTKFDTKLATFEKSRAKPSTKTLDDLQEAFQRLGPTKQREELKELRELAKSTGKEKFDDLADLLKNVLKPPERQSRPRTVYRPPGGK